MTTTRLRISDEELLRRIDTEERVIQPDFRMLAILTELRAARQKLSRAEQLVKALEHIQGMAGNPDAAQGCRNIIERARLALEKWRSK